LLDALERELLAAQTSEVRDAWRETGRAYNIVLQEVRALLDEAIAASEEGSAAILPPDIRIRLDPPPNVSGQLRAAPRGHPHLNALSSSSRRQH
jgi:hypothetical protein